MQPKQSQRGTHAGSICENVTKRQRGNDDSARGSGREASRQGLCKELHRNIVEAG
jgi:hypothetical protein